MVINPIVGVYIPIIRIPIKGVMTIPDIATLTVAHIRSPFFWNDQRLQLEWWNKRVRVRRKFLCRLTTIRTSPSFVGRVATFWLPNGAPAKRSSPKSSTFGLPGHQLHTHHLEWTFLTFWAVRLFPRLLWTSSGVRLKIFEPQKFGVHHVRTLLHDKINPKDCQVLSLGDSGFLQFFRVVSSDYGKPRNCTKKRAGA